MLLRLDPREWKVPVIELHNVLEYFKIDSKLTLIVSEVFSNI